MSRNVNSKKVRYGIIGCGEAFWKHAEAIRRNEESELAAVFDIDDRRAVSAAAKYGCGKKFDVDAMFKDPDIDAVIICTPHHTHKNLVLQAIKAEKYAICEKPLVLSSKEGEEILRSEHYKNNVITVFQTRFSDAARVLFNLLSSGQLGEIRLCNVEVYKYRDAIYFKNDWRGDPQKSGGMLPTQGIHALDKMRLVCGWPKEVHSFYKNSRPELKKNEDVYVAALEFENGIVGVVTVSTAVKHPRYDHRLFIAGSKGSIAIGGRDFERILHLDLENGNHAVLSFPPASPTGYQNFLAAVNNFILRGIRDPLLPFAEDGILATAFIEKLHAAESKQN